MPAELQSAAQFLRRTLRLVADSSPEGYRRIVGSLRGVPGRYRVDGEELMVRVVGDRVAVRAARGDDEARVHGAAPARAIVELVDGTTTAARLLVERRIDLRGDGDALLCLSAVARIVAASAVTHPPIQRHFEEFRRWAARSAPTDEPAGAGTTPAG